MGGTDGMCLDGIEEQFKRQAHRLGVGKGEPRGQGTGKGISRWKKRGRREHW